jgi:aminomethyltransferase
MQLKRTPLYEKHKALKARMVPFAGWEMPVSYSSIINEHMQVRERAGLFDISHMGEIIVSGPDAIPFLEGLTCNTIEDMEMGQVRYNAILNDRGGLVDDITVYRIDAHEFFLVVNGANREAVANYLNINSNAGVSIRDVSDDYVQLAVQGPLAKRALSPILSEEQLDMKYYRFRDIKHDGRSYRLSRTGYTGEDGYEVYLSVQDGIRLWDALIESGGEGALLPCGLGARDSLRLEARFPLYGHELNAEMSPVESGIGWIVKEKKIPFRGYDRVMEHKKSGTGKRVIGFVMEENAIPREGYPVIVPGMDERFSVLSGAYSPVLKKGIGTALLPSSIKAGDEIQIEIRSKGVPAKTLTGPFVRGSAGKG